ncbi:MAG TPA: hypothetical protein DCL15_06925 [Chloroflexi bacterium]|nr:hypothetical protein [Chloroflexota bacterium]
MSRPGPATLICIERWQGATMITGKQIGQIVDALLSAFSTRTDLAMLVTIELDEHLDAITTASNLRADVFALVQWAIARNRLNELIAGARRQNPGNARLRALPAQFEETSMRQGEGEIARGGDSYAVGTAINSVVGPQGRVVNIYGSGDAAALAEMRAALAELNVKIDRLFEHVDQRSLQSVALIYRRIDALDRDVSAAIVALVQQNALTADELDRHLSVVRLALQEAHNLTTHMADRDLAAGVAAARRLAEDPTLDARHKLEVTIPIIPLLLEYKFETELGSRANLVALWEALKAKVQSRHGA